MKRLAAELKIKRRFSSDKYNTLIINDEKSTESPDSVNILGSGYVVHILLDELLDDVETSEVDWIRGNCKEREKFVKGNYKVHFSLVVKFQFV